MSEPKAHWWSTDRFDKSIPAPHTLDESDALWREAELAAARERARLSVLPLTDRDKRFLRALAIEC
jgi:hypothetical protein